MTREYITKQIHYKWLNLLKGPTGRILEMPMLAILVLVTRSDENARIGIPKVPLAAWDPKAFNGII